MKSHLNLSNKASVEIVRPAKPQAQSDLSPHGHFKVEHWRAGRLIGEYEFPNGVTDEGKKHILDVMFHDATKVSTWYIGLIDSASFSALDATDVYQQINGKGGDGNTNGWREFEDYTDENNGSSATTRPEWPEEAASGTGTVTMTNGTTKAVFKVTAAGAGSTIKGLFICGGVASCQNKGDYSAGGFLWATALFTQGDTPVNENDVLNVTYSVSA
jgi:hypothetical protein